MAPGAPGLGAPVTYANCGHQRRKRIVRAFFDFLQLCTGKLDMTKWLGGRGAAEQCEQPGAVHRLQRAGLYSGGCRLGVHAGLAGNGA
jgi:hypothetical protein